MADLATDHPAPTSAGSETHASAGARRRAPVSAPLRVLIVDAHPAVGLGLRRLVGIMPGIEVCGLAARGEDGLTHASLTPPDVALVDAELPNDAGLSLIRQLRASLPTTRIVALGLYTARRAAALAAGAHTFVLKDAGFDALRAAITTDATGIRPTDVRTHFDRDLASAPTPRS
jgi:DNA-binding NarL/FixJ family response regulator